MNERLTMTSTLMTTLDISPLLPASPGFALLAAGCRRSRTEREVWEAACDAVESVECEMSGGQVEGVEAALVPRLLKAFVFCYAQGILTSSEVGDYIEEDPTLTMIFGGRVPRVETLRRFRRVYRGLLERCLTTLLQSRGGLGSFELSVQPGLVGVGAAAKARAVLDRAVRMDMMDGDI